ncbi:zinc finger BED domain-containing protein RICESLEEPER 2 [Artemisia annua]|uniref:Zinc finger BED domain-containing protein RICESLEEPER 2 n=1 Tax=Artemisia annua TaxID=35608 RepID=A0A2U1NMK6_ARTAN|nr:zinc finger BED domain-containing protein RICESLEEPER 2 [Artemisia annua]
MLFASEKYEKAFSLFEILDPAFKHHLEETCGVPDHDDWENARKVSGFLADSWFLTKNMFGFDATSDTLIDRIARIELKFCDWAKSVDTKTITMTNFSGLAASIIVGGWRKRALAESLGEDNGW